MPSLRLTPFPPPRWAIMPESDDVVIGKVAEDGDLGAKSLYLSVHFFCQNRQKTDIQLCFALKMASGETIC